MGVVLTSKLPLHVCLLHFCFREIIINFLNTHLKVAFLLLNLMLLNSSTLTSKVIFLSHKTVAFKCTHGDKSY